MRQLLPVRTATPGVDLLEVADARRHCKIDHNEDDELLRGLIASVTGALEAPAGILRVCLLKQTWRDTWDAFPPAGEALRLSVEPLLEVSAVEYVADGETTWTTLAAENYWATSTALGADIELADGASWPDTATRPAAVRVTYTAGYGIQAKDVPQAIVHAARLMVAHYYENREASIVGVTAQDLPLGVRHLLTPFLRVPT